MYCMYFQIRGWIGCSDITQSSPDEHGCQAHGGIWKVAVFAATESFSSRDFWKLVTFVLQIRILRFGCRCISRKCTSDLQVNFFLRQKTKAKIAFLVSFIHSFGAKIQIIFFFQIFEPPFVRLFRGLDNPANISRWGLPQIRRNR